MTNLCALNERYAFCYFVKITLKIKSKNIFDTMSDRQRKLQKEEAPMSMNTSEQINPK